MSNNFPVSESFTKSADNLRAIEKLITQIERMHKGALRSNDESQIDAMRLMHFLNIGIWAEARLRKVTFDPTGFNDAERAIIWGIRSQEDRWKKCVELAFRRHHLIPIHMQMGPASMPQADFDRFQHVIELLAEKLAPVITSRNRIAHGQWVHQLKSRSEDKWMLSNALEVPNYCGLKARNEVLNQIGELIGILAVSKPTFDRDYQKILKKLNSSAWSLDGQNQSNFVRSLRKSSLRSFSL